jgi:hypothetical protein
MPRYEYQVHGKDFPGWTEAAAWDDRDLEGRDRWTPRGPLKKAVWDRDGRLPWTTSTSVGQKEGARIPAKRKAQSTGLEKPGNLRSSSLMIADLIGGDERKLAVPVSSLELA